jgi:outer membrane protein
VAAFGRWGIVVPVERVVRAVALEGHRFPVREPEAGGTMNNRVAAILVLLCLTLGFATTSVHAMGLEVAVGGWKQDPQGDFGYVGTQLSLEDELRYGDKTRPMGRIKLETPLLLPNLYLMATPMNFSADGSRSLNFQFGDKTFDASQPFSTKLKLDHYDVTLFYGIPGLKTATANIINLDLGLGARIVDFKIEATGIEFGTGNQIHESKAQTVPVPMLFVGAQIKPVKWFAVEGEFRGFTDGWNRYYDAIGRVKLKILGPAFLAGGYRYERLKLDVRDVKANARFGGPFAEIGVEF